MNKLNLPLLILSSTFALSLPTYADEVDHTKMDHNAHMMQTNQTPIAGAPTLPTKTATPLKEAGNALFGTIQEAIKQLDANPNTNWEEVDLEGLRQHLIDMDNFSSFVDVLSDEKIEKGSKIIIKAQNPIAQASLKRAMDAHPGMLKSETSWNMTATPDGDKYVLIITTEKPAEVARLRALGYIGIMALGDHHQVHHWAMASGSDPHAGHDMSH
jgi:hypothetical protein